MTPILSSIEGMVSLYLASQSGSPTAQSIRETIAQLCTASMFNGKITEAEAEDLARLIEEK